MRRRRRTGAPDGRRGDGECRRGVAINVVSALNQATIGTGSTINAEWLTVEAKRTEVKGDTTGTIGAEAISGASGGKIGIAGSLALNIADSTNEALIKGGSTVTLDRRGREGHCRRVDGFHGAGHGQGVLRSAGREGDGRGGHGADHDGHPDRDGRGPGHGDSCRDREGRPEVHAAGRHQLYGVAERATKVQDILDKINNADGNGGKLLASFDEAKQQFVFTDKTTPDRGDGCDVGDADGEPGVFSTGKGGLR